jgi:cysteine-rich repeat protein
MATSSTLTAFHLAALTFVVGAGACFDGSVGSGGAITCRTGDDCPAGLVCPTELLLCVSPDIFTADVCGDGIVNGPQEQCDDGAANSNAPGACRLDCKLPRCGDATVDPGEGCDDGNDTETDDCTSACVQARCGDGIIQDALEECDDGNLDPTDACLPTCIDNQCGDGFLHAGIEACDDGNVDNTDACAACSQARCGDGFTFDPFEVCDDGNVEGGDGCSANCLKREVCGDSIVDTAEVCDDGNSNPSDACSQSCEQVFWTPTIVAGRTTQTPATVLAFPTRVAFDRAGAIFIAFDDATVSQFEPTTGSLTPVAGTTSPRAPISAAQEAARLLQDHPALTEPLTEIVDMEAHDSGVLYVLHRNQARTQTIVRAVNLRTGIMTTIAGAGAVAPDASPRVATSVGLTATFISAAGNGDVILADANTTYRVVVADGTITSVGTSVRPIVGMTAQRSGGTKLVTDNGVVQGGGTFRGASALGFTQSAAFAILTDDGFAVTAPLTARLVPRDVQGFDLATQRTTEAFIMIESESPFSERRVLTKCFADTGVCTRLASFGTAPALVSSPVSYPPHRPIGYLRGANVPNDILLDGFLATVSGTGRLPFPLPPVGIAVLATTPPLFLVDNAPFNDPSIYRDPLGSSFVAAVRHRQLPVSLPGFELDELIVASFIPEDPSIVFSIVNLFSGVTDFTNPLPLPASLTGLHAAAYSARTDTIVVMGEGTGLFSITIPPLVTERTTELDFVVSPISTPPFSATAGLDVDALGVISFLDLDTSSLVRVGTAGGVTSLALPPETDDIVPLDVPTLLTAPPPGGFHIGRLVDFSVKQTGSILLLTTTAQEDAFAEFEMTTTTLVTSRGSNEPNNTAGPLDFVRLDAPIGMVQLADETQLVLSADGKVRHVTASRVDPAIQAFGRPAAIAYSRALDLAFAATPTGPATTRLAVLEPAGADWQELRSTILQAAVRSLSFDDTSSRLFIGRADNSIDTIRADFTGLTPRVAGVPTVSGFTGDNGPAAAAAMSVAAAALGLPGGAFLFSDTANNRLRVVDSTGTVTTFLGNGDASNAGEGNALALPVNQPQGLTTDDYGNVVVAAGTAIRLLVTDTAVPTVLTPYGGETRLFPKLTCITAVVGTGGGTLRAADACTGILFDLVRSE